MIVRRLNLAGPLHAPSARKRAAESPSAISLPMRITAVSGGRGLSFSAWASVMPRRSGMTRNATPLASLTL